MFVKIENYLGDKDSTLIINLEKISTIRNAYVDYQTRTGSYHKEFIFISDSFKEKRKDKYIVTMDTLDDFILNKEQYEQICKILTTRL